MFRATHHPSSGAQNCNCSFWFYIRFWLPVAAMAEPSQRPVTTNVCKTRGCNSSFELLMMGGVSSETCWAIKKLWNNKFYYTVASCWFFKWILYNDARIHEHHVTNKAQCIKYFLINLGIKGLNVIGKTFLCVFYFFVTGRRPNDCVAIIWYVDVIINVVVSINP